MTLQSMPSARLFSAGVLALGTLAFSGCQRSADDGNATSATMSGIPNPEALEAVISAEQSFSAMSIETGTRAAFLAYFADDAVTFVPQPVVGTGILSALPEDPELEWWPEIAEASLAGDMGYTSGPYRSPLPDGAFAWGHYHTVWGLQEDGSWRVLLDMGGPHGEVALPDAVERPESSWGEPTVEFSAETLMDADRAFLKAYEADGAAALERFALPRARFYRFGQTPLLGVDQALRDHEENAERSSWEPADGGVSASGDLGYTYGTGTVTRSGLGNDPRQTSYARVWRREGDGAWKVVLEVVLPYPPGEAAGS